MMNSSSSYNDVQIITNSLVGLELSPSLAISGRELNAYERTWFDNHPGCYYSSIGKGSYASHFLNAFSISSLNMKHGEIPKQSSEIWTIDAEFPEILNGSAKTLIAQQNNIDRPYMEVVNPYLLGCISHKYAVNEALAIYISEKNQEVSTGKGR